MVERNARGWHFPKRYIFLILGYIGMINTYAMRVNLSVAMVAMVDKGNSTFDNGSNFYASECPVEEDDQQGVEQTNYKGDRYSWDPEMQGWILSSFYYGYFVMNLFGGYVADRIGAVRVFGGGIVFAAILTLVTPLVVRWGAWPFMAIRVLEGAGEGVTFPAMVSILSRWSPRLERSRISTIVFSGTTTGTIVTMWVSGWLCATDFLGGWPSVFYVAGFSTCLWFVFWGIFVYESPHSHPTITRAELSLFDDMEKTKDQVFNVPWKEILTSVPFWALLAGNFGSVFGLFLLLSELPTYLSTALHFNVSDAGAFSAVPHILLLISMWGISFIADKLRSSRMLSATAIRKMFQSISGYGPAVCLLAITFSGCHSYLIVALFCIALGLKGGMYSGFNTTHVEMSPDFAGTIYGLTNGIACLSGFMAPSMVGYFTSNGFTLANWNKVFYATSAIYIVTTTIFLLFASAELQPWGKAVIDRDDKNNPETNIQMLEKNSKENLYL